MFTHGAFACLVVVPRLMSAEYDHVIDVPHISYDEWVAFHNEVAFDLWGYEVEKQIFKLVALDGYCNTTYCRSDGQHHKSRILQHHTLTDLSLRFKRIADFCGA